MSLLLKGVCDSFGELKESSFVVLLNIVNGNGEREREKERERERK